MSVGTSKDYIIKDLPVRLEKDETLVAIDESPEIGILEKIPEKMSEMQWGRKNPKKISAKFSAE